MNGFSINSEKRFDSTKTYSPTRLVMRRFFKNKLSVVGLIMIFMILAFCFIGPLFTGYTDTQTFFIEREVDMISEERFIGQDQNEYRFFDVSKSIVTDKAPPSVEHRLGTDSNRMDVLTRLMYGGRLSVSIAVIVVLSETIIGVLLGGMAGYFGKFTDLLIMRLVDIFACIPALPVLLIASQVIRSIEEISPDSRIYWLMGMLAFFGWAETARLVRGQVLSLREQDFMTAAEAVGIRPGSKIFKHLLPNIMPQLIVSITLGLGTVILYESTLSYLGLGVQFPKAAWGTMVSAADPIKGVEILAHYPNLWIPPGILIVVSVLSFNFIGDGLRDAFDPKIKN